MMLPVGRRVENAWMTLEQRGAPPAELLSADIYDSWMRCISFGLDTLRPPSPQFVSPAILRQEQQRCSLVRGLALAEMHTLHQQIAGSNFMIAFANADGLLLDIISDPSFSDASNAASIRPGTVWTESICGTNGLGTAAHLKRAIVVHGREHFFRATTILPASQRRSSRPMANWPEYWMLRRIACPGTLTRRRWSPWRRPRSRMGCSVSIIAEIS